MKTINNIFEKNSFGIKNLQSREQIKKSIPGNKVQNIITTLLVLFIFHSFLYTSISKLYLLGRRNYAR